MFDRLEHPQKKKENQKRYFYLHSHKMLSRSRCKKNYNESCWFSYMKLMHCIWVLAYLFLILLKNEILESIASQGETEDLHRIENII